MRRKSEGELNSCYLDLGYQGLWYINASCIMGEYLNCYGPPFCWNGIPRASCKGHGPEDINKLVTKA